MSILIKGIKMPKRGEKIIILTSSGYVEDVSGQVIQGAEAVELSLHGRLIDADAFPAADAAPVRHGCWIADKEDVEWGNYLIHYRCSECKERPHFDKDRYEFILSPYCPNCGAKMEE